MVHPLQVARVMLRSPLKQRQSTDTGRTSHVLKCETDRVGIYREMREERKTRMRSDFNRSGSKSTPN